MTERNEGRDACNGSPLHGAIQTQPPSGLCYVGQTEDTDRHRRIKLAKAQSHSLSELRSFDADVS